MTPSPFHQRTSARPARVTGFTLIEILIALVIFSIGLLGLAGMQLRGSEGTNMAYFRSQATLIANDMAERLHANRGGAYADDAYLNLDSTGICAGGAPTNICATRGNTQGTPCTPAQMATFDLYTLACSIDGANGTKALLPSGKLRVVCNDFDALYATPDADPCSAGSSHTVTVSWNEVSDGKSVPSDVSLEVLP